MPSMSQNLILNMFAELQKAATIAAFRNRLPITFPMKPIIFLFLFMLLMKHIATVKWNWSGANEYSFSLFLSIHVNHHLKLFVNVRSFVKNSIFVLLKCENFVERSTDCSKNEKEKKLIRFIYTLRSKPFSRAMSYKNLFAIIV